MHTKDSLTLSQVRQVDMYLTVETSGTQQSLVEHVHTVCGSQHNHTAVGTEAVHLGKQSVQRVFTFIIATHSRVLASGTSNGINLINEDDAGSFLLGLAEHVAHTACTHTYEHLNKVGTTH